MAQTDYNVAPAKAPRDPHTDVCDCGTSVVLPAHPTIHCPSCHKTYRGRGLTRPNRCAACNYNLFAFRQRNGIPELQPKYV